MFTEKETDAAVSMLTLQSNVNNTGNTGAAVRDKYGNRRFE
jgi:hypothetical protein